MSIRNVNLGKDVQIIEPVNLYECEIGDDSFIGPFVEIQKNAKIGLRSRIQSHTFICELVTIGNDCFVGHGVMFTNDTFVSGGPSMEIQNWKNTRIGNKVNIGSNSTLLPVDICDNVVIGAGSVVTKSIFKSGVYAGNPAKWIRNL